MSFNALRLKNLDRFLWRPLYLTGYCIAFLSQNRQKWDRPLIIRPGGLGDLILLCIALEELRLDPKHYYWLVETRSKEWADLLSLNYKCYDSNSFSVFMNWAGHFPVVINSEQLYGLSQAAAQWALASTGKTIAFSTNRAARFANDVVPYDPLESHETVEFSRLLIQALDLKHPLPDAIFRKRKTPPSGKPLVGLGGLQAKSRSLSEEQWFRLVREWAQDRPLQIASSPQDAPFARRLAENFHGRAETLLLPFPDLCRHIEIAEEVFTIDSGFQHVASYYGVPVTTIFTSSRQKKWLPLSPGSRLVKRTDLPCQPCALFAQVPPCPHDYACKQLDYAINKIDIPGGPS